MSNFKEHFNNKEELVAFANELKVYNAELEKVYIAMIDEIRNRSLNKAINKVFCNRLHEVVSEDTFLVTAGTAAYSDDKEIRVHPRGRYMYSYDIKNVLLHLVTFTHGNQYKEATMTTDDKFNENSIAEIVSVINANRKRVANYMDAANKADSYIKAYEDAIVNFINTTEQINPLFVDFDAVIKLYVKGRAYDFKKFDGVLEKYVEKFEIK